MKKSFFSALALSIVLLPVAPLEAAPLNPVAEAAAKLKSLCPSIELIVPIAAGGLTDAAAREIERELVANGLSTSVVNKPGGGGALALNTVFLSRNQCTVLVAINSIVTLSPLILKLSKDPLTELTFIGEFFGGPSIIVGNPNGKYPTLESILKAIASGADLAYASGGIGSLASHIPAEMIAADLGGKLTHIPTTGGPRPMMLLANNEVNFTFGFASLVAPFVQNGQATILAHTGRGTQIIGGAPVESVSDLARKYGMALPDIEKNPVDLWIGSWLRAGPNAKEIGAAIATIIANTRKSATAQRLAEINGQTFPTPTSAPRNLKAERAFSARIVHDLQLKAE